MRRSALKFRETTLTNLSIKLGISIITDTSPYMKRMIIMEKKTGLHNQISQ